MMEPFRVSSQSHVGKTAGAIAGLIRDHRHAELQAVGAGAVYRTVKAIATTSRYLQEDEIRIAFTVSSVHVNIDGRDITAILFMIDPL